MNQDRQHRCPEYYCSESGRVGYFVLWLMGAPAGLLLLMWVLLGNSIFGPG